MATPAKRIHKSLEYITNWKSLSPIPTRQLHLNTLTVREQQEVLRILCLGSATKSISPLITLYYFDKRPRLQQSPILINQLANTTAGSFQNPLYQWTYKNGVLNTWGSFLLLLASFTLHPLLWWRAMSKTLSHFTKGLRNARHVQWTFRVLWTSPLTYVNNRNSSLSFQSCPFSNRLLYRLMLYTSPL
jgi:hypothetical protein